MTRLVTYVDIDDQQPYPGFHVKARHELELDDGTRVLLLDDRGWSASPWTPMSMEEIEGLTRMVVGPDEPFGDMSREDMAADHWATLQRTALQQGVFVQATELRQLPHDVILTQRLLARVGRGPTQEERDHFL